MRNKDSLLALAWFLSTFESIGGFSILQVARKAWLASTNQIGDAGGATFMVRPELTRSTFFSACGFVAATSLFFCQEVDVANAFDGGIGGLGKTKPQTGVELFSDLSAPVQNVAGVVSAEIKVGGQPVRVQFQTPWPLLATTAGLEARDITQPESAFVQVVTRLPKQRLQQPLSKKDFNEIMLSSVLSQQGKYGAYSAPTDVKIKLTADPNVFLVSFTAYTPGLRESERQALVKCFPITGTGSLVLLVVGTTTPRFKTQQPNLQKVVDSFEAIPAPTSQLR